MIKIRLITNSSATFAPSFAAFAFKFFLLLFLLVILNSEMVFTQEAGNSELITSVAEELAGEDQGDIESYIDRLSELAENPVNLNSGSEDELSRLFFLTDFQVRSLIDYTRTSGRLVSAYELPSIPGFDRETASLMLPFITIEDSKTSTPLFGPLRNHLLTNITYRTGNDYSSSPGSPVRFLAKHRITSGRFTAGFTLEKDPGEKLFTGKPVRPEFLSSYILYSGEGNVKKIIAGDFAARFGLGTGINTSFGMSLPLTTPGYLASRNEIKQYTSTGENNFFRGAATELAFGKLSTTLFLSSNMADATPSDSVNGVEGFYTSGLHDTETGMERKDVVRNIAWGINASYSIKNVRVGMLWSEDRLSLPVIAGGNDPEKKFDFSGRSNSLYSFYYSALIKNVILFGEASFNSSFSHAIVQGLSLRLSGRLTVNGLYRKLEPGYFSLHGRGPGSSSGNWNERSMMAGFSFEAAKHLFISGGCDMRKFPWLKYRCSSPSSSLRQELRIRFLPAENLSAEVLYNYRSSYYDIPESNGIPATEELSYNYVRGSVRYSPVKGLILTTRTDYKSVGRGEEKGMLLLQDAAYSFRKIPLSFWFRYCIFSTGSWDARLYTYENDLLYSFSIPALSGEGSRSYIMVKWEFGDFAEVRLKYGITSTGNSEINSVIKEDFRFQARIYF
jgi:hypothetical protein